ncbi:MAG TPA: DUF1064 domain-containing protein [Clostridia bacterium]|jgi:hypothetical protein|nr:DUF1064 domain-containing protein [Clostridia bacterium]HPY42815.1 DUF1064 domain-containing protein [Clostridia bacterium]HQA97542.1 DUF1064 domain-containing protein [Clostridia bacterium]HQO56114.1 DUF1064 domain-containing protein [Clostridia bacterium]HUM60724.1 DUF1064 domain-containing protein [Clostridia bacterium]
MSGKRFDEEWLRKYQQRTGCRAVQTGGAVDQGKQPGKAKESEQTRTNKYGNKPVTQAAGRFDSRHEARVYERLRLEALTGGQGAHIGLARQVTFFLPGGVKYLADFVLLYRDQSFRVLDAMSEGTRGNAVYRLKKRQLKHCLGLEIEEV